VLFASAAFGVLGTWAPPSWVSAWVLGCVVASVLGHIYTPFLKFKGGKGVATTFGAVLGFFPLFTFTALVGLLVFLITLALWRYISASSIAAGIAMSISAFVFALRSEQWNFARVLNGPSMLLVGVMWVLSALVIYKHRANIARLRAGTEPKVGQRVVAQPAAAQQA
jgi:glycerol-3-phosphate acyltransferase PlsY